LSGAELIARHSRDFSYVVVNERAEELVLYGRDILGDSVLYASKKLCQNKIVIILNQDRESIRAFLQKIFLKKAKSQRTHYLTHEFIYETKTISVAFIISSKL
jgi:predicted ribosome-associated RNA-binding protein Tma20